MNPNVHGFGYEGVCVLDHKQHSTFTSQVLFWDTANLKESDLSVGQVLHVVGESISNIMCIYKTV